MFLTDNELEEFKKTETFKMLIKGTYLGVMENNFKNMTKKQLVDWSFKREAQIFDLKDQLALTEKALELACKEITGSCEYCSYKTTIECPVEANCLDEKINYFKTKAKEMMKSE